MVRKKSFCKEAYRTVWRTKSRFLSIFCITAIGVGFFAGINATSPDMEDSIDQYFSDSNLSDIQIVSPIGFSEDSIREIEETDGVDSVATGYAKDFFVTTEDNLTVTTRIFSYNSNNSDVQMNTPWVVSGRLPSKSGEIAVSEKDCEKFNLEIGSQVTLSLPSGDLVSDYVSTMTYTIVGQVETPVFFSYERGQTNIGDGSVDTFAYIFEDDFTSARPTDVYVRTTDSLSMKAYDENYESSLEPLQEQFALLGKDIMTQEIDTYSAKLSAAITDLQSEREEAQAIIDLANSQKDAVTQEELLAAQASISEIDEKIEYANQKASVLSQLAPSWYVLDRSDNPGYDEYGDDTDRIGAVARIFPVFFVLVAVLVCLTTMTRMVEEERVQVGTLKALGYNARTIAGKYILYAMTASFLGAATGLCVGFWLFPTIIMNAYSVMYSLPAHLIHFQYKLALFSVLIAVIAMLLATLYAIINELKAEPATLMLPKAPRPGKRILLERIRPIWKRLSFSHKVTARNIFRYKQRFLMTVLGISGCTALLLTGFGLRDSIDAIMVKQFDEIFLYDGQILLDTSQDTNSDIVAEYLASCPEVSDFLITNVQTGSTYSAETKTRTQTYLLIAENEDQIHDFYNLRDRESQKSILVDDSGAVITEKLASLLDVSVGDQVSFVDAQNQVFSVTISDIAENYLTHYLYVSPKYYEEITGSAPVYDVIAFHLHDGLTQEEVSSFKESTLNEKGITAVSLTKTVRENFHVVLESLDYVVLVLILSAGALAFVVLYNLTNINITERIREIATIKVLGFRDKEVSAYVYRENTILTILGILTGLLLGIGLHKFVIQTMEVDNMMFGRIITPMSYVYSILLTLFFSIVVNVLMYFRLRKINMVESMKSVD